MRRLPIIAAAVAAIAVHSATYAGLHYDGPVGVYRAAGGGGSAYGSMSTARYSTGDAIQFIGCASGNDTASLSFIACYAADANNNSAYCYSSTADNTVREAVTSINSSSFVIFDFDSTGKCTYVGVSNLSYYLQ
jgi:hypothetical protein